MVENVEMTPEPSHQEQADEMSMQVDEISHPQLIDTSGGAAASVLLRTQSTNRIRMFPKLDSKLCIVNVLSYLLCWEQAEKFFRCLNKQGQAYFDQHKAQFRHFIDDRPIPRMALEFGSKSF